MLADETADSIIISAVSEEVTAEPLGGEDNDELFAGYVDQLFGDRLFTEDTGVFFAAARPNEEKLTGIDKLVFDALKAHVIAVAAGEKTDATFRVTAKELGLSDIRYTAADLGVADLTNANVNAAIAEMRRLTSYNHSKVRMALMNDIPYEMFWYDKTVAYTYQADPKLPDPQNPSYDISIKRSNDMSYLCWDENAYFELPMYVSADYSADGSAGTSA
ncbi:MAG: hypothetical protein HUJ75_00870, partial [Parasporobacterium sp.]|nr:hypothetical protein [Parasporobacterium sp.]